MPRVSVIIPSCRPRMLADAMASVQEQTHEDVELLVLYRKPHATDTAATVADKINHLASIATGDFIAVLPDDDTIHHTALEKMVDRAVRSGADLVYTDTKIIGPRVGELGLLGLTPIFHMPTFDAEVLKMYCVPWMFSLITRDMWLQCGGYDRGQDYGDWALALEMCYRGAIAEHIREPLYEFRDHANNGGRVMNDQKALRKLRAKYSFFPVLDNGERVPAAAVAGA